ncbi:MAG: membrane protein insertion efficiency factor YidD [Clostridia bacterium]|nr:membrane protein insertion efficiency factor YidD [Clostridia bacterium]
MTRFLIKAVRFYQKYISPYKGGSCCRFVPTCSEYAILALKKYGAIKGSFLALRRIFKCHPFHKGGYDPLE